MRIGVLTSGGDCAGLNAALRAVVLHASGSYGWQVVGIRDGTHGLLASPPQADELSAAQMGSAMLRLGGTVLGTTNQGDPFAYPMGDGRVVDRSAEFVANFRMLRLDALIGIGGDGSLAILRRLARQGGFQFIGVPKTIDNDVDLTEVAIGHDTAVAVATDALDRLQPTAASHSRVMVVEVMGRDAGHIALVAGIAGGADVILIPEIPYFMAAVAQKVRALREGGRNYALVVVAEAVRTEDGRALSLAPGRLGGIGHVIAARIAEETKAETRVTVLGHLQRGGMPSPRDRLMGSAFGVHAVDLVAQGKTDRMVAWQNRVVVDVALADAIAHTRTVDIDGPTVRTARGLGICLGDR